MDEPESLFNRLLSKNVPFVIFREPGQEAKLLVQNSPLNLDKKAAIEERGFYAFPFSPREKAPPLFFAPDHFIDFKDRDSLDMEISKLEISEIPVQRLYEVDQEDYVEDLNKYVKTFEQQNIKKAIYSRIVTDDLSAEFDLERFFIQLQEKYAKAFVYVMHIPGDGIWIGASPELLLSYNDEMAKTVALAGTLKIDQNLAAPEWTRKEIDEHRLVEKHIIKLCGDMKLDYEKSRVRTSNTGKVYHLKSDFTLKVAPENIIEFLRKLHPTPAISGLPQDKSLELIYSTEKHDRSYYCGFLGFVNDIEEFNLYINLRCMKVQGKKYSLFAGGGITPESDIGKEWEETKVKMATLTDLLPNNVDYKEISSVSY